MRDEEILVSKSVLADLLFDAIQIMETAANKSTCVETVKDLTIGYTRLIEKIKENKIGETDGKQKEKGT